MTKKYMYLKMISASLIRRRSRMFVALLAVAIGATVLSGLVTIYYDVPRQMATEFRSYGANVLLLGEDDFLLRENIEEVKNLIPDSKLVGLTPFRYEQAKIATHTFSTVGIDFESITKTSPYWYILGSMPKTEGELIIGNTVSQITSLSSGDNFTLTGLDKNGNTFTKEFFISGVLQTGGSEEECIYLSLKESEDLFKNSFFDVAEISISASSNELESIVENISQNVKGVKMRIVKRLSSSEGSVLTKLQALVFIVTLVVLLLTMVCVATTMMAVVAERRKEIGLKKSLGASNKSIVSEFLGESLFLGAGGGVLGVVLGFVFAELVSRNVFMRSVSFEVFLIPITIFTSIVITGLACLIPVRSATYIDPALVLKGE